MRKKQFNPTTIALSLCVFASVSTADLIAYWPFDDGEGFVALDSVGGFDGVISGGT